jgi:hypothetical protein
VIRLFKVDQQHRPGWNAVSDDVLFRKWQPTFDARQHQIILVARNVPELYCD